MKHYPPAPKRAVCLLMFICILLLSFGTVALAADEPTPATTVAPLPPYPEDMEEITVSLLYPTDVTMVTNGGSRQIVKTYTLSADESPADIPRRSFERDGWMYELSDITQQRTTADETKNHVEMVTINTDTQEINKILALLSPTLEYKAEDGFCGLLTLDLASVKCEVEGYKTSSYTASATREYPNLSSNDTSLIPKTITDNGRTLQLDGVTWKFEMMESVDYDYIPTSYTAIAKYTAKATSKTVTGYITTAAYVGVERCGSPPYFIIEDGHIKVLASSPRCIIPKVYFWEFVASRRFIDAWSKSDTFIKVPECFKAWQATR